MRISDPLSQFSGSREVAISAPGGADVLVVRPVTVAGPGAGELLVAVTAAGINRHDCNQRRRGPGPEHGDVPGLEVSGHVVAVGPGVTGWRPGDRVAALVEGGGYADHVRVRADLALPVPGEMDLTAAAALPEALFTSWYNFFDVAALGPGESVLLHGGTSGVGVIAIQLLTALGHPVFVTCGSADKMQLARGLGAVEAFSYRDDGFVAGVQAQTGGRGVDMILDMSGGRHSVASVAALARRGRIVHLSPGDGAEFRVPLRAILAKEARITGSLLRPLPAAEKARIAGRLRAVAWPLVVAGRIRPVIHRLYPLAEVAAAHAEMELGAHAGKILLGCAGIVPASCGVAA